jgi:hypothetical protein
MTKRGVPYDLIKGEAKLRETQQEPPRTIDFLPYVFPPENMVAFDVVDSQTVNAGVTAVIPIFGPVNSNAVIRWFGNEVTNVAGYPDIAWTIFVGGIGYQPYVAMLYSRGSVDNPDPIIIRVAPNRIVTVNVVNSSGVSNWVVRTRLKGWFY